MSRPRHHTQIPLPKPHPLIEAEVTRIGWVLQVWSDVWKGPRDRRPPSVVGRWLDVVFDGIRFKRPDRLGLDTFDAVGDRVMAGRLLRFFVCRHPDELFRVIHVMDVRTVDQVMELSPEYRGRA